MAGKRILFIDGDENFTRSMADAAEARGFETLTTASSNDGVELARTERPDLIFVSVELAPTNGWSVCTKLKKDDDLKAIPIVLTSSTSTSDTFEKHKKLKTRADEYLLKPYSSDDLIRVAGDLVGLPELMPLDEELVVEDESLSLGDRDQPLADEAIAVEDDEPLDAYGADLGGEASVDDELGEEPAELGLAAESALDGLGLDASEVDPLAAMDGADDLGGEFDDAPALSDDEPANDTDDLDAFDRSFESVTPPPHEDSPAEMPFDEPFAAADEGDALSTEAASLEVAEDAAFGEDEFAEEGLSLEEAPLEVPADDGTGDGSEPFDTGGQSENILDSGEFSENLGGEAFDPEASTRISTAPYDVGDSAELEARITELEAELEGYRATESSRDAEIETLRGDISRKDREALELRSQLTEKDRELLTVRENETRLSGEAARLRDEKVRREATVKALTTKTELLTQTAKKFQAEGNAAKEEVKSLRTRIAALEADKLASDDAIGELAALKDRHAASEAQAEDLRGQVDAATAQLGDLLAQVDVSNTLTEELRGQIDATDTQLEDLRSQVDVSNALTEELRAQLDDARGTREAEVAAAKSEAEALREDLDEARKTAERALANAGALQEKLADADQRADAASKRTQDHHDRVKRVRDSLMTVIDTELG